MHARASLRRRHRRPVGGCRRRRPPPSGRPANEGQTPSLCMPPEGRLGQGKKQKGWAQGANELQRFTRLPRASVLLHDAVCSRKDRISYYYDSACSPLSHVSRSCLRPACCFQRPRSRALRDRTERCTPPRHFSQLTAGRRRRGLLPLRRKPPDEAAPAGDDAPLGDGLRPAQEDGDLRACAARRGAARALRRCSARGERTLVSSPNSTRRTTSTSWRASRPTLRTCVAARCGA